MIQNNILIVAGSLVGASGIILTNIMCKAMNRSLANVLFSGFGSVVVKTTGAEQGEVKPVSVDDGYYLLEAASSVSVERQKEIEASDTLDFSDYLAEWNAYHV